jgi:hypothetical protein
MYRSSSRRRVKRELAISMMEMTPTTQTPMMMMMMMALMEASSDH